jgi:hypothetical protein
MGCIIVAGLNGRCKVVADTGQSWGSNIFESRIWDWLVVETDEIEYTKRVIQSHAVMTLSAGHSSRNNM